MIDSLKQLLGAGRPKPAKTDFQPLTGQEAVDALLALPTARRHSAALALLYRKSLRPEPLEEQLVLLRAMSSWADLPRHDRAYALVAAGHKACECVKRDVLAELIPELRANLDWALTQPYRKALRRDGLHLRFSLLNVLLNAALLTQSDMAESLADTSLEQLDNINLRRTSPYLFNSTGNITKTATLAGLLRPERLPALPARLDALMDFSMRFRGQTPFERWKAGHLRDMSAGRAYGEFTETVERVNLLRRSVEGNLAADALATIAETVVGQRTQEQKTATLEALVNRCASRW